MKEKFLKLYAEIKLKFFGKKKIIQKNILNTTNIGLEVSNKLDINKMIEDNTIDLNNIADFKDFPLLGYLQMDGNYYQHYGNGKFIVIIANKIEA